MAVTTQNSTQVANQVATPAVKPPADEYAGVVRFALGNFVQSGVGDANSLANLVRLPPGARVVSTSKVFFSALGTGVTLDVGFTAHTEADGTSVSAVVDKFIDGLDVSGAGIGFIGTGTNGVVTFQFAEEIKEGFVLIQGKFLGAAVADADTLDAHFFYVKE